jgi:hypothetical protein
MHAVGVDFRDVNLVAERDGGKDFRNRLADLAGAFLAFAD